MGRGAVYLVGTHPPCPSPRSVGSLAGWMWHLYFLTSRAKIEGNHSGFPGGASGKDPSCNAGDIRDEGLIPGSGRSPGGEHSNPVQYSCLENPMDSGAWWAMVHGVATSQTRLR